MSIDGRHFFGGTHILRQTQITCFIVLFLTQKPAGVIGGLVEATRSDKDHVAQLHQLHSAATAEKWAVVDRLTSEAQMIRLTK